MLIVKKRIVKGLNGKNRVKFEIGHVGDTKAYALSLSQKKILKETKDQSEIQEQIDERIVEPVDRWLRIDNRLTNGIRSKGLKVSPEIFTVEGEEGDIMVVTCTDGGSDFFTPEEILEISMEHKLPGEMKLGFRDRLLAMISKFGKTESKARFVSADLPILGKKIRELALSRHKKVFSIKFKGSLYKVDRMLADDLTVALTI